MTKKKPATTRELMEHMTGILEYWLDMAMGSIENEKFDEVVWPLEEAKCYIKILGDLGEEKILPEDLDRRVYLLSQAWSLIATRLKKEGRIDLFRKKT